MPITEEEILEVISRPDEIITADGFVTFIKKYNGDKLVKIKTEHKHVDCCSDPANCGGGINILEIYVNGELEKDD